MDDAVVMRHCKSLENFYRGRTLSYMGSKGRKIVHAWTQYATRSGNQTGNLSNASLPITSLFQIEDKWMNIFFYNFYWKTMDEPGSCWMIRKAIL